MARPRSRITKKKAPTKPARTPTKKAQPKAKRKASRAGVAAPKGVFAVLPDLPDPASLYRDAVALAVLDAIEAAPFRTFQVWREKDHIHFRYHHGNGDTLDAFFSSVGHLLRGFDHESPVSPFELDDLVPGLYEGLPEPLSQWTLATRDEQTVDTGDQAAATFAVWHHAGRWHAGAPELPDFGPYEGDGSSYLLGCIRPQVRFIEQANIPAAFVDKVMRHHRLSDQDIRQVMSAARVSRVRAYMKAVGYGQPFPFARA